MRASRGSAPRSLEEAPFVPETMGTNGLRLALVGVFVVAVLLRIPGLLWGLPDASKAFPYHPDEPTIVEIGRHIALSGDLNPHFFNYGSLLLYLSALAAKLVGGGSIEHYLVLRMLSLACGLGTLWVAFALGRRQFGNGVGLMAAGLVAVAPVHTICSTYATVDSLATLLFVTSFWFGSRLLDRFSPRDIVLCGLFAGLSAGTKYFGIVGALVAMSAALIRTRGRPKPNEWLWLGAGVAAAVGAFLLTTPYALLDMTAFRAGASFEMAHKQAGGSTVPEGMSGLVFLLTRAGPAGLTWPVMVAAGLGLALMCRRCSPSDLLLAVWFVLLILLTGSGREVFVRYDMLLVPFVAIIAASVCALLRPTAVAWAIVGLCGLYALAYSAAYAGIRARPDTRDEALAFVQERSHNAALRDAPWFDDPPVSGINGGPRTRALFERLAAENGWRITITGWDGEALSRAGSDLLVVSEFDYRPEYLLGGVWKDAQAFWSAADRDYQLLREFKSPPTLGPITFPNARINDWRYLNPEIRVYERRVGGQR